MRKQRKSKALANLAADGASGRYDRRDELLSALLADGLPGAPSTSRKRASVSQRRSVLSRTEDIPASKPLRRAYPYTRVSSDESAASNLSIPDQVEQLRSYCARISVTCNEVQDAS